jgi:hypothetical protein
MSDIRTRRRAFAATTASLLLTSALAACNGQAAPGAAPSDSGSAVAAVDAAPAALPLATAVPAPIATAPPVTELPDGRRTRVAHLTNRRDGYGYLDRAYYQQNAVENAPPDYSFDSGGVRPWTWATGDGARVISEPVAGGYRYYYYNAGSDRPYLVRDPRNSYAYDNGALVGVYSPSGEWIDAGENSPSVRYAGRYYDRGNTLWRGANHAPQLSVNAYDWGDRRADIAAQRNAWRQRMQSNPEWTSWNNEHRDQEQGYWNDARDRHQQAAQRFGTWQQNHYQGAQPQYYDNPDQGGNGNPNPNPTQRRDHTAAIVGGVVGVGIVATVANAVFGHRDAPHPAPGQAPVPPAPANGYQRGPDQYAPRPAQGQNAPGPSPGFAPQAPSQPAAAPAARPPLAPARPGYAPAAPAAQRPVGMRPQPAPNPARAAQPAVPARVAPVPAQPVMVRPAPARVTPVPVMPVRPVVVRPAPVRVVPVPVMPVRPVVVRPAPARVAPVPVMPVRPVVVAPAPVRVAPVPVMPVRPVVVRPAPVRVVPVPVMPVRPPVVHGPAAVVHPGPAHPPHQPAERDRPHDAHDQHHGPGD